jgi:hypothetical protein
MSIIVVERRAGLLPPKRFASLVSARRRSPQRLFVGTFLLLTAYLVKSVPRALKYLAYLANAADLLDFGTF